MAYSICAVIIGIIACVFPVVYIGIKLIGNNLDTGVAAQVSVTQWYLMFTIWVHFVFIWIHCEWVFVVKAKATIVWRKQVPFWRNDDLRDVLDQHA